MFDEDGEAHFREIEHTTVTELMRGERAVVALGGGAVQDARTRAVLGSGGPDARVVYLQVDYDEALARVGRDESRPMLHRTGLAELYERRLPAYRELAVVTVATGGRSADAVVTEVLHRLGEDPHRP